MRAPSWRHLILATVLLAVAFIATSAAAFSSAAAAPTGQPQRLLVQARSAADYDSLRSDLEKSGAKILIDLRQINLLVISTTNTGLKGALAANPRAAAVASDGVRRLIRPELQQEFFGKAFSAKPEQTRIQIKGSGRLLPHTQASPTIGISSDPAVTDYSGLMWNLVRIRAPQALNQPLGYGYQSVKVAVADTGLDYTHVELKNKVDKVVDFTVNEQPNICSYYFGGPTDADLAGMTGGPVDGDFNGHGTWIGGNIAGALDGEGINGIVPGVQLVSLKISQWCGSAYDSTILDAFAYAADNGIDVVSISFGGYLDRSDREQDLIYRWYRSVVDYARSKGTLIVAAAGNEHTKIGAGGLVISHGILDVPPGGTDYYGLWETPGGVPGVVMVSATGNVVNGPSATCPADSLAADGHQWCKPASDAHQPKGVGDKNQLTYYSNFGPRIDFAAPGGARKFNIPAADRGGTEGWPWTGLDSVFGGSSVADGYNAWEDFSITSNYAFEIPCFTFTGQPGFPDDECYAIIQGTSMATPHVSAVAAAAISTHPLGLRKNPSALYSFLASRSRHPTGNKMTAVSKTDTSNTDYTNLACPGGFCHLGNWVIPDDQVYGKGFIDDLNAVMK